MDMLVLDGELEETVGTGVGPFAAFPPVSLKKSYHYFSLNKRKHKLIMKENKIRYRENNS